MADDKLPDDVAEFLNNVAGKVTADDKGGVGILISSSENLIRIDFSDTLKWIALPKEQAINFALMILQHCKVPVQVNVVPTPPQGGDPN